MNKHACPRCGLEGSDFKRDPSWADRHPAAAVLFALPAGYTLVGVILAYPWFCVPLLVVAAAWWVDRRNRRRAAIAARADHEHRELMARAIWTSSEGSRLKSDPLMPVKPQRLPQSQIPRFEPGVSDLPIGRLPRARGADHWSPTQPIRRTA